MLQMAMTSTVILKKSNRLFTPLARLLFVDKGSTIKFGLRCSSSFQALRPYVDPKLSYAYGRSNDTLIYSTIYSEFNRRLEVAPDQLAYVSVYEDKKATMAQFDKDVNTVAKAMLYRFGIKRGDAVGVYSYNSYNWLVVQFACSRIGAVLTPINPSYKSQELAYILRTSQVKCLFTQGPRSVQAKLNNHTQTLQSEQIMSLAKSDKLKLSSVIFMDPLIEYDLSKFNLGPKCAFFNWTATQLDGIVYKSVEDCLKAGDSESEATIVDLNSINPDDLFAIYFTSGTTGDPKGACVSQFTAVNNARICFRRLLHGRPKNWNLKVASTLPLFHIYAGVLNTCGPLFGNAQTIFTGFKYDIETYTKAIIKHEANVTTLTPTILIDMISYIEANNVTNFPLKIVQSGGAYLPPEVTKRAFKVMPNLEEVRIGYGATENGSISTIQTIHEPYETRPLTVGQPIDFTEIRVVDPETNKVLPLGEKGELQTRGHNIMVEYLDQPEKTQETIIEGRWYRTGDIGFMHPHGSLQICNRIKHLIIKGGENIYPEEIRRLILDLSYVEDAHVIGVPDDRYGEQVCVWIKLKAGYQGLADDRNPSCDAMKTSDAQTIEKAQVIEHCKKSLTYFKVPKYVIFVDEFPMTPTKKVQNHLMLEQTCEILNLNAKKSK